MGLLDGDIARAVLSGLAGAGMTKPATLTVVTKGIRDPGNLTGGTNPSETALACKGLVVTWKRERLGGTLVQVGQRVVLLLGASIAGGVVPKIGDRITIEGVTSPILDIERDAASAAYNCLVRGV